MHHHVNHCFCTDAAHNNDFYDAENIVGMTKYEDSDKEDWENLVVYEKVVNEADKKMHEDFRRDHPEAFNPDIPPFDSAEFFTRDTPTFKPEVFKWLKENIKDQDGEPGWAIGSDQYRVHNVLSLDLFFKRRNDAKKFIRTFSRYKKRTSYYNHFDDTNLVLDLETGKYKNRHEEA
jgi:hypothetical protein